MATLKKSARKKSASSQNDNLQAQAERLSRNLSESAQQVWLAGVGAFGRAQAEGTKLFETLVKEGLSLEQTTRKLAGGRVEAVRGAVETTVGQARERASDTWDRLEKSSRNECNARCAGWKYPAVKISPLCSIAWTRSTANYASWVARRHRRSVQRPKKPSNPPPRKHQQSARPRNPLDEMHCSGAAVVSGQFIVARQHRKRNNHSGPASPHEVRMLPSPYGFGLAGLLLSAREPRFSGRRYFAARV